MRLDVYIHFPQEQDKKLDEILDLLKSIKRKEDAMSKELDALESQVKATTDLEQSAVVLIQGLAQQIADLKDDPVQLQALSDSLKASADALSVAVVANTPAAP